MRYLHDKAMTDLNFVQVLYQNWQINQKVQRLRTFNVSERLEAA